MSISAMIRKRRKAIHRWASTRVRRVLTRFGRRNMDRAARKAQYRRTMAATPVRQTVKPSAPKASPTTGPAAVKRKADGKFNGSKPTQSTAAAKKAAARKSAQTTRILLAGNKRVARTDKRIGSK